MSKFCFALLAASVSVVAWAQDNPERVAVPLTDPGRPATLRVNLLSGSITVRGHQGKEVIVESRGGSGKRRGSEESGGMRRIDVRGSGLSVEEQDNVVRVGGTHNHVDLDIQVPVQTNVNLRTVNSGQIRVSGLAGELDVNNVNGGVTLENVSGTVLAHALNGEVKVTLDQVTPDKPMSFSTLNGNIDVTFPPDIKANVKMKSENGEMYTDFDIATKAAPSPQAERSEGKYKIRFDRAVYGSINGGGPEMQFTTLNGKIYIRKKK
jgi:hypothetical protein